MSLHPRVAEMLGFPFRHSPRFHGWKPDKPDHRDLRYMASGGHVPVPPSAMLEGADIFLPPIRDQGEQGSCTGFSVSGAIEFKRAQLGQGTEQLSPRFAYYNGRAIEGEPNTDSGAEVRDVIKGVHRLGICLETLCPYGGDLGDRPSFAAYREALTDIVSGYSRVDGTNLDAVKAALLDGNPVVFGFSTYENFDDGDVSETGLMSMPVGNVTGGHAVWIVGYDDTLVTPDAMGALLIANSWGTDWGTQGPNGERGYFFMPYSFSTNPNLADDFWAIQMVQ